MQQLKIKSGGYGMQTLRMDEEGIRRLAYADLAGGPGTKKNHSLIHTYIYIYTHTQM